MTFRETRKAYAGRADEYVTRLGSMSETAAVDRELIEAWASAQAGPILDVGCGPGQWTDWLQRLGHDVVGIDPVLGFVENARESYPNARFREGRAEALGVDGSSLAGILAWYSLIHIPPEQISNALDEFARALQPGGGLCVGFFEGPELRPFPHAVAEAYFWPLPLIAGKIERAGFTLTTAHARADAGKRPHGAITARRHT